MKKEIITNLKKEIENVFTEDVNLQTLNDLKIEYLQTSHTQTMIILFYRLFPSV